MPLSFDYKCKYVSLGGSSEDSYSDEPASFDTVAIKQELRALERECKSFVRTHSETVVDLQQYFYIKWRLEDMLKNEAGEF